MQFRLKCAHVVVISLALLFFFKQRLWLRQGMATFSSKIAPNVYILIFKEQRHIYNDLKIKRENSQVHSLLQITKLVPG